MKPALLTLLTLFVVSCTVTKRVHRPGWHVEWKKRHQSEVVQEMEPAYKPEGASKPERTPSDPSWQEQAVLNGPEDLEFDDRAPELGDRSIEEIAVEREVEEVSVVETVLSDEKEEDESLKMKNDHGAMTFLIVGSIIVLVMLTVILAMATQTLFVPYIAVYYILATGLMLVALSFLVHFIWKGNEKRIKSGKSQPMRRLEKSEQIGRSHLVLFTLLFASALGLLLGYTYLFDVALLTMGILALIGVCAVGTLLSIQLLRTAMENGKPVTPSLGRGYAFLTAAGLTAAGAVSLLALNHWVIGITLVTVNGLSVTFIFFALAFLIFALIGLDKLATILDW